MNVQREEDNLADLAMECDIYRKAVEDAWSANCEFPLSVAIAGDAAVAHYRGDSETSWRNDWRRRVGGRVSIWKLEEAIQELRSNSLWPWASEGKAQ